MPSTIDLDLCGVPLLDSPWSLRLGRGTRGRTALEVYNNGLLLDVLVAKPLSADVLRGGRRGERDGRPSVLAWGHLPPDGLPPDVWFSQRHREQRVQPVAVAGDFWVALRAGCYDHVSAARPGGGAQRMRIRAGWSR